MKYWTHFSLRMMARAGLSVAVLLWTAGHWGEAAQAPINLDGTLGANEFRAQISAAHLRVWYLHFNAVPPSLTGPYFRAKSLPGVSLYWKGSYYVAINLSHWLLCLTFLIATVATHWRWKKPETVKETDK